MRELDKWDRRFARSYIVKVGDEIIVQPPEEGLAHAIFRETPSGATKEPALPFVGKLGVVVSCPLKYVCRWQSGGIWSWSYRDHSEGPGFYQDTLFRKVRMADGTEFVIHVDDLDLPDASEAERRIVALKLHERRRFEPGPPVTKVKMCDLPDTAFWEGDYVRMKPGVEMASPVPPDYHPRNFPERTSRGEGVGMIKAIEFRLRDADWRHPCCMESPDVRPMFSIGDDFLNHCGIHWTEDELELVERGNHWRIAHGQPPKFLSLEEEAFFSYETGGTEEILPRQYRESYQKAVEDLLRTGEGQALVYHDNGGVSWDFDDWWELHRFKDASLRNRLLAAFPIGFCIPTSDFVDQRERSRRHGEDWPRSDK